MTQVTITGPRGASVRLVGSYQGSTAGDLILGPTPGWSNLPSWRGSVTPRVAAGVVLGPVSTGGRAIDLAGWAYIADGSPDARREQVRALADQFGALWQDGDRLGDLRMVDGSSDRSAAVQPEPGSEWLLDTSLGHLGWFRFGVALVAPDPYLYGPARSSTLTPEGAGGGRAYPLAYPLSYGAGTSGGTILSNGGNAPAWPVVTVAVDDPAGFRLDLGGRVLEVVSPCSPDAPITVDMAGTVTAAGGGDITFRLGRREWGSVPPGGSVPLTLTTMQGGPGYATATIRDTYL